MMRQGEAEKVPYKVERVRIEIAKRDVVNKKAKTRDENGPACWDYVQLLPDGTDCFRIIFIHCVCRYPGRRG
jgi:hypothetical protein